MASDSDSSDFSESEYTSSSDVSGTSDSSDGSDYEDCGYEMSCVDGKCSRRRVDSSGKPSSGYKDGGSGKCCVGGKCSRRGGGSAKLPFDPLSIEKIILMLFKKFDFRILMEEGRSRTAAMVTAGFALAGGLIGRSVAGKVGAAVGGVVGGACGVGVVAISMCDVWEDIKYKLSELVELVYDYIAGMDLKDYQTAASFLMSNGDDLASMVLSHASAALGKNIVSTLTQ